MGKCVRDLTPSSSLTDSPEKVRIAKGKGRSSGHGSGSQTAKPSVVVVPEVDSQEPCVKLMETTIGRMKMEVITPVSSRAPARPRPQELESVPAAAEADARETSTTEEGPRKRIVRKQSTLPDNGKGKKPAVADKELQEDRKGKGKERKPTKKELREKAAEEYHREQEEQRMYFTKIQEELEKAKRKRKAAKPTEGSVGEDNEKDLKGDTNSEEQDETDAGRGTGPRFEGKGAELDETGRGQRKKQDLSDI